MSDKLQQAVERLQRIAKGESLEEVYNDSGQYDSFTCRIGLMTVKLEKDRKILADAYLAEHPADDDEPITAEWLDRLESIGSSKTVSKNWYGFYNNEGIEASFFQPNETTPYELTIDHQVTVDAKTRGDFRRVCKVMKIELKEPS